MNKLFLNLSLPVERNLVDVFFRHCFVAACCITAFFAVGFDRQLFATEKAKNVVLFVVDDQGFQAGCYGHPNIKTPGIDRLAKHGIRFNNAYCTTASCSASRSVLLTGMHTHATGAYGHVHGYNHFSTYETVRSLPVLLNEAGYRTCSIGKYHVAPKWVYEFQEFRNKGIQGARNSIRMAANAREWISESDDRPFFLYFCTSDPHRGAGTDGFSNFNDDPKHYPGVTAVKYQPSEIDVPPWLPDTPETRIELAEYFQAISRLDQGMSNLLDALEETGHWDDTLIIFLSDNGPPFPGAKTNLYQPGANLPLIVRDPRIDKQGTVSNAHISWTDITPTILEFCGVRPTKGPAVRPFETTGQRITQSGKKVPYKNHGRSFLPVLGQEPSADWKQVYGSHTFHEITMYYPMRMLIRGKYKYIVNFAHQLPYPFASDLYASKTWQSVLTGKSDFFGKRTVYNYVHRPLNELYDLEADPHEINNLANDPQHLRVLADMQERIKNWQKETKDPWALKWTYE